MIVGAVKRLSFANLRLEIRPHPHNRNENILRLYKEGQPDPLHAEPQALRLLRFLADQHPGEELTADQIYEALWGKGEDVGGNVEKQVSSLRTILGDRKPYRIIATLPSHGGYKFIAEVRAEGDLGRVDGLLRWSNSRFFDLLSKVRRNDEDQEDLRVATTGFLSLQDLSFDELLRNHVRIRIVMMDPKNTALLKARCDLRQDGTTAADARIDFNNQIRQLNRLTDRYSKDALEVRLSNAMPSGFLVHSRNWALLGIFLAQGSYVIGPMIEAPAETSLWQTLYDDWKLRWDPKRIRPQNNKR